MAPLVSVVIPSRDRAEVLERAIESALAQTETRLEVVVVADGYDPPLRRPPQPRVRLVRLDRSRGIAGARNAGLAAASGKWVTFLDDDDRLTPGMVERSLAAIDRSSMPPPVAAISAIDVLGPGDRLLDRRVPPSHPRGEHFLLEELPPGRSHLTKQTLVAETELLRSIGGFDAELRLRELSDLFLRLNPVCSIVGLEEPGYLLTRAGGEHSSRDPERVRHGFEQLVAKHRELLAEHPRGYADLLLGQARVTFQFGPRRSVWPVLAKALRLAPGHALRVLLDPRRTIPAALRPSRTG